MNVADVLTRGVDEVIVKESLEKKINNIVYDLYGLSEEDREIIENSKI